MAFFNNRKRSLFDPPAGYRTPGIGDGQRDWLSPDDGGPPPEEKPRGFWQGGEKVRGNDILAAVLATIGDTFDPSGRGGAIDALTGRRNSAMDQAKKASAQQQEIMAARQRAQAAGLDPAKADLLAHGDAKYGDLNAPEEDTFLRRMRAAGIDPASPQGQAILQQKLAVDSSPNPSLIGDATSGWTWQTPPAPALPSAPQAQTQLNVGGEWLTPPKLGQQAPSIQDIQAERERRRQQRGY